MKRISIIIPVCNEEGCITQFYNILKQALKKKRINYELLFIDDGSQDKSLPIIKKIVDSDKKANYYSFSRNFGKEAAMYCGLEKATGDYIVIMDADLQHPPDVLVEMYEIINKRNVDSVVAIRKKKSHLLSKIFYSFISKMSSIKFVDGETDFRIMTRNMVDNILRMNERKRFSKGIFNWVGFNKEYYEYDDVKRHDGNSKWDFKKLFVYALDGLISFSDSLLYIPFYIGLLLLIISLLLTILLIIKQSPFVLIIVILLFLFSIVFFVLFLMGLYLESINKEVKRRPLYIIKETSKKE